jgi:DNA protecting protein DprA
VPGSGGLAEAIRDSKPRLLTEGRELRGYLAQRSIRVIAATDPEFPKQLRELPGGPLWLFVEGNTSILNAGIFVAVVGTREGSDTGLRTAEQVTWLAAKCGIGLVSGLAEGIDAAAHSAAARNNVPQVGVLGTGINITFPRSTASLRRQLVKTGGCVITEYLPNENYGKSQFVQRNRIQAGLASAVCPVEGKASSGTMHTVRFAAKYERKLFGVIRGPAGEGNEMPDILAKMGTPVFDLAEPEGRSQLQLFFQAIPGPRFPTPERPSPEFSFRSVLKALDTVASYDELTRDDKLYLLEQVRQRLGLDDE